MRAPSTGKTGNRRARRITTMQFDDHGFFKGPPDQFLAHIEKLHAQQDHSMHFNTNVLIEFQSPERAFVETYVLVLQRFRPGGPSVPPGAAGLRNMASARYLDLFEKRNGEWRVVHRTLVFGDIVGEPMSETLAFPPISRCRNTGSTIQCIDCGTR